MDLALTVGEFDLTGGIERVTVQLALVYRALGHDVTVYATRWDRSYEDRFRFVRVAAPDRPAWLRTTMLPSATARALERHDMVHGQGTSTLSCDLLTFHSVHAAWCAAGIAAEGALSPRGLAKRLRPFHRATIAMEQKQVRSHRGLFHACSPEVGDEVVTWYGADPSRVVPLPWGVDLAHFRPDPAAREATRAAWAARPGDRVLLLVANELARKGLATILGAMAKQGRPDVRLVVVGRDDPAPYRALIAQLGLGGRVKFTGSQDPAPAYQAADLFVMPSSYEGWGLVLAEALACGLPAVVSRFPGSVAMVQPGENGLLLDSARDEAELASALDAALDPQTHATMTAAARPSVARYAWPEVGRTLVDLGLRAAAERR